MTETETEPAGRERRPLWLHALLLLVFLGGLAAWTGTRSSFVTDEAFVVIQLDHLDDTGAWALPHPLPEVDPEGAAFPLHGASRFSSGYTLYGKHPLLVYVYQPVYEAFGLAGLLGLSVLGTVAAALAAAALAERIRHGSGPLALWLVGLASPLFFDAFVIHAHTLAAGLAALAAFLALRFVDRPRWWLAAGITVALIVAALLRTEGVLFAAALGGVVGLLGIIRRRIELVGLGAAAIGSGAAAFLVDRAWSDAVAEGQAITVDEFVRNDVSFLAGRLSGIAYTLVMPGYRGGSLAEMLTAVGAVLLVVGAVLVRRRPGDRGAVFVAALGALLLLVRSFLQWGPVPGLIVAFPVGVAGIVLLGGSVWRSETTRILLAISAAFMVAVVLTQYAAGGHTEWGGRYFALCVPLLGAVSAASLQRVADSWTPARWRPLALAFGVASVGLCVLALTTVRGAHDRNRMRSDGVLAAALAMPSDGTGLPVVVTDDEQIPRLARGRYGEVRFLTVTPPYLERYLGRLADAGVRDVLLVAEDPDRALTEIPPVYEVVGAVLPHALQYEDGGGLLRLHLGGADG